MITVQSNTPIQEKNVSGEHQVRNKTASANTINNDNTQTTLDNQNIITNISSNGLQNDPNIAEIQQFHRKRDLSLN